MKAEELRKRILFVLGAETRDYKQDNKIDGLIQKALDEERDKDYSKVIEIGVEQERKRVLEIIEKELRWLHPSIMDSLKEKIKEEFK